MSRKLVHSVAACLCFTLAQALNPGEGLYAGATAHPNGSPVVFTAYDYGFAGPDWIAAGVTTIQVLNKGQDPHHIQLFKLLGGKTAEDFRAMIAAGPGPLPDWAKFVGGPNAVLPGDESEATMNLDEGEYLLACIIPNKQGVPHMALGMQKRLSVRGAKPTLLSEPKAGLTITLMDFRFAQSTSITAGSHTIRVVNHGT